MRLSTPIPLSPPKPTRRNGVKPAVTERGRRAAAASRAKAMRALAVIEPLGLTDEQIGVTVVGDSGDPAWSGRDVLLVQLCEELYANNPTRGVVMSSNTTVAGKSVLVTGANRGLGRALVEEALRRGAKRVYAASRQPLVHADARLTPVILDVTNNVQIQQAVEGVEVLDILINNAGVALPDDLSDRAAVDRHLAVNLFGPWGVTEAFLPSLTRSGGAIVNVVSLGAFAAVPVLPAYSISKAAAFSLTQSLRALLAGRGVNVHAVMPGPIDTDMVRDLPVPKTPPESVARSIFDGIENGEEEIFPDPVAEMMAESWRTGAAKALERQNAALVQQQPLAA